MTSPAETVTVRAAMEDDLSRPLEGLRRDLKTTAREVKNLGDKGSGSALGLGRLEGKVLGVGRATGRILGAGVRTGVLALAGLTAAAGIASVKLIGLAADAQETASKYRTVFGPAVGEVDKVLQGLHDRFGIATKDLQDAASTFGVFGKAAGVPAKELAGFSTSLTQAGLDLASFYNADPGDVFLALRSGLAGEAEPLRQFGIFLSDATLKAEAASLGLRGELTESQKVMVRQRLILKGLGDANGDLARTSDSLSNQMRNLKGRLTEAATTIGTALLPAATALVNELTDRVGPATDALATRLPGALERAGDAFAHVRYLVTDFLQILDRAGASPAVEWLDRVTGAGGNLTGTFEQVKGVLDDVTAIVRNGLVPGLTDAAGAIDPAWLTPLGAARLLLGFLADNTTLVHTAVVVLTAALIVNRGVMLATTVVAKAQAAVLFVQTAATYGLSYALKAGGTAAKLYAAAQWLVNAAIAANPIGLIIIGIAALVAGFVLAWKHSETFRKVMTEAFRLVAGAAVDMVDGVLAGIQWLMEGLGKLPGPLGAPFRAAAGQIENARGRLQDLNTAIDNMGRKKANPSIKLLGVGAAEEEIVRLEKRITNFGGVQVRVNVPKPRGSARTGGVQGDTLRPHAAGITGQPPRSLSRTLAFHAAITGPGTQITSAVRDYALGSIDSDHRRGKALDLRGGNLQRYRQQARDAGAYAEFHGDGPTRHLHLAVGDTPAPRAPRPPRPGSGGGVIVYGGVHVDARGAASDVDVVAAVLDALEQAKTDAVELAAVEEWS